MREPPIILQEVIRNCSKGHVQYIPWHLYETAFFWPFCVWCGNAELLSIYRVSSYTRDILCLLPGMPDIALQRYQEWKRKQEVAGE